MKRRYGVLGVILASLLLTFLAPNAYAATSFSSSTCGSFNYVLRAQQNIRDSNGNFLGKIKLYQSNGGVGNVLCASVDKTNGPLWGTPTYIGIAWSETGPGYKWVNGSTYQDSGNYYYYASPVYVSRGTGDLCSRITGYIYVGSTEYSQTWNVCTYHATNTPPSGSI
jgi:hypothetical protein